MQRKRSIPHSFDERLAAEKKQLDDQLKAALDAAVREFAGDFATRRASAA